MALFTVVSAIAHEVLIHAYWSLGALLGGIYFILSRCHDSGPRFQVKLYGCTDRERRIIASYTSRANQSFGVA